MVHQGPEAVDVTNDYVVHALNVEGLDGVMIEGHHIGKRRARDPERAEGKEL